MSPPDPHHLQRFVDAQAGIFEIALQELRSGTKESHWMWFIFPQLAELGRSSTAIFYGIRSLAEARAYLAHPLLGHRLQESVDAALGWAGRRTAEQIFGPVDGVKLRSSLTLFDRALPAGIYADALIRFFESADERTLALLHGED